MQVRIVKIQEDVIPDLRGILTTPESRRIMQSIGEDFRQEVIQNAWNEQDFEGARQPRNKVETLARKGRKRASSQGKSLIDTGEHFARKSGIGIKAIPNAVEIFFKETLDVTARQLFKWFSEKGLPYFSPMGGQPPQHLIKRYQNWLAQLIIGKLKQTEHAASGSAYGYTSGGYGLEQE